MAVTVLTLLLIYVLTILVVAIVLSLPNYNVRHQGLIAALFALIIGAVVVSLVPTDVADPFQLMLYNTLLILAYLLPVIVLIVLCTTGAHHAHDSLKAKINCDKDGENCKIEQLDFRNESGPNNRVKVSFGR